MKPLRIVFMGTPEFAVPSLAALAEAGHEIAAVVASPDRPAGRGRKLLPSAVKRYASEKGYSVLQPVRLKAPDFIASLRQLQADVFVVVAFRMLPEVVWGMPPMGTVNLHASLLPQYRGAAPIQRAVANGEAITGVTVFFIEKDIDTGRILFRREIAIAPEDTAGDVHDRLMAAGAALLRETLAALSEGSVQPVLQDCYAGAVPLKAAPKLFREDTRIDWRRPAADLYNHIRGMSPSPGAWTTLISPAGEACVLKIFFARIRPAHTYASALPEPGTLQTDGGDILSIAAADGFLTLTDVQWEGKRRMSVADFLRGAPNIAGYRAE